MSRVRRGRQSASVMVRVGRVGAGALAVRALGIVLLLAVEIAVARAVTRHAFGVYASIFALLNLVVLVAKLGSDTAAIRYLSTYRSRGDREGVGAFIAYSFRLVIGMSAALAALWAAISAIYPGYGDENTRLPFVLASMALPLFALTRLCEGILRGLGWGGLALAPFALVYPAALLAGLYGHQLASSQQLGAVSIVALQIVAFALCAGTAVRFVAPKFGRVSDKGYVERKEWLRASLVLLAYGAFAIVLGQVDILMVGVMLGVEEAGAYAVAWRISTLLGAFLIALNFGLAPLVATHYAQGRLWVLEGSLNRALRWVLLASTAAALMVVVGREQALSVFGEEYVAAKTILVVLVLSQLANVAGGPVGILLNMSDHSGAATAVLGGAALVNMVGNLILIPAIGATGAAVSTAVSCVVWNVGFAVLVRTRLGIRVPAVRLRRSDQASG